MTNEQRATDALQKIEKVLNEIKDLFPETKAKTIQVSKTAYSNAFVVLKRISGIIANYNENNAEMKLKNVMGILGVTPKKER